MRIRTIKPEFWQSESMASVSRDARLVAIALLNYADDEGIFLANERVFKGALFPFDDDLNVPRTFQELSKIGFVAFAEHSGKTLGKVLNFRAHQRIDKPQKSRFSAENALFSTNPIAFLDHSKNIPGTILEDSETEVEREVEREVEKEPELRASAPMPRNQFSMWASIHYANLHAEAMDWFDQQDALGWVLANGDRIKSVPHLFVSNLNSGKIAKKPKGLPFL